MVPFPLGSDAIDSGQSNVLLVNCCTRVPGEDELAPWNLATLPVSEPPFTLSALVTQTSPFLSSVSAYASVCKPCPNGVCWKAVPCGENATRPAGPGSP